MNKLLLAIYLLISTSTMASYPDGNFITKEVGELTILTNEKQDSGYLFVSIFGPFGSSILSDGCSGLCYFFSTKTHTPKIDGFDGILWTEEKAARGDGRWIESTGVVSIHTKDTPTFSIPGQPNEFIGIIQNIAGATGYGSFSLYLVDTVTGAVGVKGLNWGENEWADDIEFKELTR
jgi:hypothetical protein